MKPHKTRFLVLFVVPAVASFSILASGCGQQNTQRNNINAQDAADAQAKYQDLAPAEGQYTGTVLLAQTHQSFAMQLSLSRQMEPARSAQSQDPSESVSIPILEGPMSFPVLDALENEDVTDQLEDILHFKALTAPMGLNWRANLKNGTFDGTNLVLPYSVGNSSDIYGELNGQLVDGHYTGNWLAEEPSSTVGTFDLVVQNGSGS